MAWESLTIKQKTKKNLEKLKDSFKISWSEMIDKLIDDFEAKK